MEVYYRVNGQDIPLRVCALRKDQDSERAGLKRLKSLFHYNEIPVKLDRSACAWFYGKLLLAALCETIVNTGRFSPEGETKAAAARLSLWRELGIVQTFVVHLILDTFLCSAWFGRIYRLPLLCAGSKRKRSPLVRGPAQALENTYKYRIYLRSYND
ncbi:MAG: hypothetical protein LBQ88_19850 [Treponema sp.]|nr:hypothetical protein [Treponema sp.]